MPDFSKLTSVSAASGFKNYNSATFSTTIASQVLAAGAFTYAIASTALNNTNSISQVQTNWSGIETSWRILNGSVALLVGAQYEIGSFYYFDNTNLNVYTYVANQTAGNVTIPTITINCRGFLFLAPF